MCFHPLTEPASCSLYPREHYEYIRKIQKNLENFSKSERKVAEVIMASPQTAIHSSIATLAKMADVSEPTVNRFCRRLDTKGFPDFKLHLAQSLANGTPYVNRNVEEDDGPDAYTHKIFESTMACLDVAKNSLDPMQVNRAVDLLTQQNVFLSLVLVRLHLLLAMLKTSSSVLISQLLVLKILSCNA